MVAYAELAMYTGFLLQTSGECWPVVYLTVYQALLWKPTSGCWRMGVKIYRYVVNYILFSDKQM